MIDLNDPKIRNSYGLIQWARLKNLQERARRLNFITDAGLLNLDKLEEQILASRLEYNSNLDKLRTVERELKEINVLMRALGQYYKAKPVYQQYRAAKNKTKFREQHITDILLYEGARKDMKAYQMAHHLEKVPGLSILKQRKQELIAAKEKLYAKRYSLKDTITVMEEAHREIVRDQQQSHNKSRQKHHGFDLS